MVKERFNEDNLSEQIGTYSFILPIHQKISRLFQKAHKLAQTGKKDELKVAENQIDLAAVQLENLTTKEFDEIKRSLEEIS